MPQRKQRLDTTEVSPHARMRRRLIGLVGLLIVLGTISVFNASVVIAFRDFHDKFYFIRNQVVFLGMGIVLAFVISRINYHIWYRLSIPLLLSVFVLLIAVFIPGIGVKALGAKRWIDLGFFTLQPTELAKFSLVIYLSAWFSYKEQKRFGPFLILLGVLLALVMMQPDMGTAMIIIGIALIMYFMSGAPIKHFMMIIPAFAAIGILLAVVSPYRFGRIMSFLDPMHDPLGTSYHIRQILISFGSGGPFGVGIGKSRQKYAYLPEANTDSIFAIIGEEMGYVGALFFILVMMSILYQLFMLSEKIPDRFGKLIVAGFATWFGLQTFINLGSMVALIPLTGVPLPFISYGGSNLVTLLIAFGVVINISYHTKSS